MGRPKAEITSFKWTPTRKFVAEGLAEGQTQQAIAAEANISDRTIRLWLAEVEFAAEVDRLSLMTGISSRAERLRIAKRVIRQKVDDKTGIETEKDILEWLKFAQGETDGIKLDLTKIAAAVGGTDEDA